MKIKFVRNFKVKKNPLIYFSVISLILFLFSFPGFASTKEDRTGNFNFNETTGLVNIPNARILKYHTAKLYIRLAKLGKYPPDRKDSGNGDAFYASPFDSDFFIWNDGDRGLLISPFKNFELNLMHVHSRKLTPVVAAKILLLKEGKHNPAVAVGVHNIFSRKEDSCYSKEVRDANSEPAPFVVATKSFGKRNELDLTVGYGGGRFRNHFFAGAEYFFDRNRNFSGIFEHDGNIYNYGIKYRAFKKRWEFGFFMQDLQEPGVTFNYTIPW